MTNSEPQKQQCTSCHRTIYYFDATGIHIKCRACRQVVTIPWEDVAKHWQEYSLFAHKSA